MEINQFVTVACLVAVCVQAAGSLAIAIILFRATRRLDQLVSSTSEAIHTRIAELGRELGMLRGELQARAESHAAQLARPASTTRPVSGDGDAGHADLVRAVVTAVAAPRAALVAGAATALSSWWSRRREGRRVRLPRGKT